MGGSVRMRRELEEKTPSLSRNRGRRIIAGEGGAQPTSRAQSQSLARPGRALAVSGTGSRVDRRRAAPHGRAGKVSEHKDRVGNYQLSFSLRGRVILDAAATTQQPAHRYSGD